MFNDGDFGKNKTEILTKNPYNVDDEECVRPLPPPGSFALGVNDGGILLTDDNDYLVVK